MYMTVCGKCHDPCALEFVPKMSMMNYHPQPMSMMDPYTAMRNRMKMYYMYMRKMAGRNPGIVKIKMGKIRRVKKKPVF